MANSSSASSSSYSNGPTPTIALLLEAYHQFQRQCEESPTALESTSAAGLVYFGIYTVGVCLQLCILPANFRLARHRSAFLLLLHINFLDLVWLLQYIWLCAEFICWHHRLPIPFSLDAYLFRLVNFCIDALYFVLALNRSMAVLDTRGHLYPRIFSEKNGKIYLVCIWATGIVYSLYVNWHPARRPFHCLNQLGYFEPSTTIPKNLLAQLPDAAFYEGIQQIYMVSIYIPVFLYIAAFTRLFHKFVQRRLSAHSVEPHHHSLHQNMANANANKQFVTASSVHLANLAFERSRLFLLCFFSQLPYLLANGLYHLSRIFQIDGQLVKMLAILWQFFGTTFHIQQPILMLLLSRDVRREVQRDFGRIQSALKAKLSH